MTGPLTGGVHHLGLAVPDLDTAQQFFTDALGWAVVGGDPSYPATFVSDGRLMLTLWRVADPAHVTNFDRKTNVGLHHLALAVPDDATLMKTFERLRNYPGVEIEVEPGFIRGDAGARHFFCAMPGGVRIEFATPFA